MSSEAYQKMDTQDWGEYNSSSVQFGQIYMEILFSEGILCPPRDMYLFIRVFFLQYYFLLYKIKDLDLRIL